MKTILVIDISIPIVYLGKLWFSSYESKCSWSIELQDSLKCNISRKTWMMKFIFAMSRNIEILYIFLILPSWMGVSWHARSTQNKKFTYLIHISKKTWGMKWFFCLQINTKVFYKMMMFCIGVTKLAQSTQNNNFAISL